MAKKDTERKVEAKGKAKQDKGGAAKADPGEQSTSMPDKALSNKDYKRELKKLHIELVNLQQWVVKKGLKVCIVFEGRDSAGKGGTIQAITERVSPRVFRVVALPSPTGREKSQMYEQRYIPHLPSAGAVVIWDRSWYNRAGVERVMGFCTEEEAQGFLHIIPLFGRSDETRLQASAYHAPARRPDTLNRSDVKLSPRERSIVCTDDSGLSKKEIARLLGVAPQTVMSHAKRVFLKLHVGTRAQAMYRAATLGLFAVR